MPATAVTQIVPVHAGNHHVLQFERRNGFGQVNGFVHIQRVGPSVADITKRAATGAFVTHDHESCRAFAKAFANVGAAGFFADGVELVLTQDLLDFVKPGGGRAGSDANPVRLFQDLTALDLDRNARQLGSGFLLGQRVLVMLALDFPDNFKGAHDVWALYGER